MGIRLETHLHTLSHGQVYLPPEKLRQAMEKRGLKATAVTNFFDISHARFLQKELPDLHIIVGQEVLAQEGHIIALGLTEMIPGHPTAAEALARIHEQGGIAIAAHPYLFSGVGANVAESLSKDLDAIEIYNGAIGYWGPLNLLAKRLAKRLGKPGVAASDTTDEGHVGRAHIELDSNDPGDVLGAIVEGRFRAHCHPLPIPVGFVIKNLLYFKRLPVCTLHAVPCVSCGCSMVVRPLRLTRRCRYCGADFKSRIICSDGCAVCMACLVERIDRVMESQRKEGWQEEVYPFFQPTASDNGL